MAVNALTPPQPGQPVAPPQGQAAPWSPSINALPASVARAQNGGALPLQMPALMPPVATPVPPPPPVTHDVTVVTTKKLAQARVLGVPPEEFGIERGARDIATCNYCFHEVVTKTESQLVAEGFDEEQVKGLIEYTGMTEIETIARDTVQEHLFAGADSVNPAARLVKLTEHYVRMDYQGNGRPCLYQVITGGDQGEILRKDGKECITPFDAMPFAATTPVPVTHRFFGRSIADLVMSIQRIKTQLLRNALDSQYYSAGADIELPEGASGPSTIDDLLGPKRPGRVIRTKAPGLLKYQEVPDTSQAAFTAMGYMDAVLASRTGVDKQSQGIDANALQNQSATAVAQVFSASQMRMKLIARIMAEGVRDMMSLLHATIRKHGQQSQTVRLRNQWVSVDPRGWKTRNDMTINVGLGAGGKAQQFAQTMALGNVQKEMVAAGKTNIVDDQKLYNSASELTKIMGHKNPDQFFNDPSEKGPDGQLLHPPVAPPPDPKAQAIQAQSQATMQEMQQKGQLSAQQSQIDGALAQMKAELDAKLKILDAHIQAADAEQKARHATQKHGQEMVHTHQEHHAAQAETALDMVATAHAHDTHMEQSQQSHHHSIEAMKAKPTKTDGDK